MKEESVRSILRLIAVVTVLLGAYLSSAAVLSLFAASSTMHGALDGVHALGGVQGTVAGMVTEMGVYAVLSDLLIAAWGVVLYYASPRLAEMIVG